MHLMPCGLNFNLKTSNIMRHRARFRVLPFAFCRANKRNLCLLGPMPNV